MNFLKVLKSDIKFKITLIITIPIFVLFMGKVITDPSNSVLIKLIILFVFFWISFLFIYLAVDDAFTFSIYSKLAYFLLFLTLFLNITVILFTGNDGINLFGGNIFNPINNIIAGSILGGIIWLIFILTKQTGMGEGDIYVYASAGLILGTERVIPAFYITIFSATIVGLILAFKKRKLKNTIIPFVPFIVFGTLISIIFTSELIEILKMLFPFVF